MRRTILALLTLASLCLSAHATSTVNPTSPAQNSTLTSAIVRNNFAAAYNDINNILGKFAKSTAPTNQTPLQDWVDTTTTPVYVFKMWNPTTSAWVSWATLNINTGAFSIISTTGSFLASPPITVGVAAGVVTYGINLDSRFTVTGGSLALASVASGHLIANCTGGSAEPGDCTWTAFADQAISSTNGVLPYRTGGSWSTIPTGVSGHTLPFLDGANTFSAAQTIFTGSSALPTSVSGTLLEIMNVDGVNSRIVLTSAGASGLVTGRASLGTLALPLTLTSGTLIASFNATGYDGTSWTTSGANGALRIYAEGTWSNTSHPTEVCDSTTPSGSLSIVDILCTHANGGVTIGALSSQGLGTLNLASIYINNVLVADSGANVSGVTLASQSSVTLGVNGGSGGSIIARGSSTGAATVSAQAAAGTPSLLWPTTSGTLASSGTSPIVVNAITGAISCPTCNVTGANVSTVSNSDGTLTISPTSGAVVASVALSHANTWLSTQTFPSPVITGHLTVEGVVSTGATGTGKFVFDTGATVALAAATITAPLPLTSGGTGNTTESYHYIETLTASASATLTTSTFTSAFDDYLFIFDNIVPATDNVGFNLTVESGGSFQATTYLNSVATTTSIDISTVNTISNVAGKGYSGQILLHNVNSTSVNKVAEGRGMFLVSGGTTVTAAGAGGFWNGGQGAVTRGRFQMTSGNVSSGTIKVIGIRNN